MSFTDLIFLGTGGAWPIPELGCDCRICQEMRLKGQERKRTALLLRGKSNLLLDCGPDIALQLSRYRLRRLDAVLITHEHGDHYLGMDALYSFMRSSPRKSYRPIPVYVTAKSWEVIKGHFGYLEEAGVIEIRGVEPGRSYSFEEFEVIPFKTNHGAFAPGSVGYLIKISNAEGDPIRLVYTSDFVDLPESPDYLLEPDYLVIQSFWLNEPRENRANHLSFQRALEYIKAWKPVKETFLIHIGDGDPVAGDPANGMAKKYDPGDPMRSPSTGLPYPVPLNQEQWQETVDQILADHRLFHKMTVTFDHLRVPL